METTQETQIETNIKEKYFLLLEELYRSFDFFNQHFCNNTLRRPIITLQGDARRKTYGWFGKGFWGETKNKDSKIDELNLTAETLHREPTHVLETLLHEMAHLKNAQNDISDCTATQYHNENFKKAAEYFGLNVGKMQGKGWALTSLGPNALTAIEILKPKLEVYGIVRKPPMKFKKEPTTISLQVDISYQEKVDYLASCFEGKRQMTEEAINMLYNKLKEK